MAAAKNWKTLFDAVERGELTAVKRLVQEGLPAGIGNPEGESAADLATKKGNLAILKYLMSQDKSLLSPYVLYLAVVNDSIEIIRYLVDECKVDILHEYNFFKGDSALHIAAREGRMEIVKYFVEQKNVDVNALNDRGESPAFSAAGNKQLPVVVYLFEQHDADVLMRDYENRNILFPAAIIGDITVPKYLMDQKQVRLETDWRDFYGRTVLHYCVVNNHLEAAKYFVEVKYADLNTFDAMQRTPLHLAAEAGHIRMVEYLYENGADPELPNIWTKTPKEVATDEKVIRFLTDFPKKRQCRSVPDELTYGSASASQPLSYARNRGMGADALFPSRNYLVDGRTSDSLKEVASISGLESFLTLASAYIGGRSKRATGYAYRSPLSPAEHVDNRVDSIAIEVIRRLG